MLVSSGFHTRKNFFEKLSAVRGRALKNCRQPCSRTGRKSLNNIGFGGATNYYCARGAHVSGRPCDLTCEVEATFALWSLNAEWRYSRCIVQCTAFGRWNFQTETKSESLMQRQRHDWSRPALCLRANSCPCHTEVPNKYRYASLNDGDTFWEMRR